MIFKWNIYQLKFLQYDRIYFSLGYDLTVPA